MDLRPAGTIVVRFMSGDGFVAPADAQVVLVAKDLSTERQGPAGSCDVEPGRWTVYPRGLGGYARPEPQEVEVKAGETVEVVFRMRRK